MNILYFDCFSGISGDMVLGALIDAGADRDFIENSLHNLKVPGWRMEVQKKQSYGIRGTKVNFIIDEEHHPHRSFKDIRMIVEKSGLPQPVVDSSLAIFHNLAVAEGKVHGKDPEDIHFHEVGAVDSILDIVGSSLAMYNLDVKRYFCSPLPPGSGYIKCAHGILPVPAPATAELLKGIPLRRLEIEGELVTPTGAAIASTLCEEFGATPDMVIINSGYGLGSKDFGLPNMLRVLLGEISVKSKRPEKNEIMVLETNIDDMNPEFYGYISQLLFKAGALDVFLFPIYMKKMRPGTLITVLCREIDFDVIKDILLKETTTLGIRVRVESRVVLNREFREINTSYGVVKVKFALDANGLPVKAAPEYENCMEVAANNSVTLQDVYNAALCEAMKLIIKK